MQRHRLNHRELGFIIKANRIADHVMATLNSEQLTAIRDQEVIEPDRRLIDFKYFNVRPWIIENIKRALRLELDRSRGKRLLDIGTGFGYFPYVCEFMEHEAQALDIDGHRLYDRVIDALGVHRQHFWVEPFKPLPANSKKFDYVTAYQIAFNRPGTPNEWGAAEWEFFVNDILENQLAPGGTLHLELNWSFNINGWYDRSCAELFARYDAKCRGNEIDIRKA